MSRSQFQPKFNLWFGMFFSVLTNVFNIMAALIENIVLHTSQNEKQYVK